MRTRVVYPILVLFVLVFAIVLALAPVLPAAGDGTYHSEHIDLVPLDGAPLRSGFVENIHVNGPKIYAMERYVLNGAAPNTEYQVTLWAYEAGSGCTEPNFPGISIPTTRFSTNLSGNGVGKAQFTPEDVVGFKTMATTWDLRWVLTTADGVPQYVTGCAVVTLD